MDIPDGKMSLDSPERRSYEKLLRSVLNHPSQPAVFALMSMQWWVGWRSGERRAALGRGWAAGRDVHELLHGQARAAVALQLVQEVYSAQYA